MKALYKSLKFKSNFTVKEKGSKFIGIALACCNENEVNMALESVKIEFPNATHYCYAYKIGFEKEKYRANDDGEPSNSAGNPILGQINSFELSNTLIVVVRYYGGTKLGVGGLITAYKSAAKAAIEENVIVEVEEKLKGEVKVDYENYPFVMNALKSLEIEILDQKSIDEIEISCSFGKSTLELLKSSLSQINNCTFVLN